MSVIAIHGRDRGCLVVNPRRIARLSGSVNPTSGVVIHHTPEKSLSRKFRQLSYHLGAYARESGVSA